MIGRDYGDQQSVTSGMAGIDRMNEQAAERKRLSMPGPQWWADFMQRLADPNTDPAALGREAAQHPEFRATVGGAAGGTGTFGPPPQQPASVLSQVQSGPGGSASLAPPGGVNPAHGPQSLGLSGQRAQTPTQPPQGQFTQSLGQMGQPMPGAPQVSPQQAGASGSMPQSQQQSGGGNFVPRADFGPPRFQGGDTVSLRDMQMIGPQIPSMLAARSRENVAQQGGDVKLQIQEMQANQRAGIETLKAQGKTDEQIVKMLLGTAKEEGLQQRNVTDNNRKLEGTKIMAEAQKGTAKIRAEGGGAQTDLKVIADQAKSLRSLIASYSRADKTFILPGLNITLGQAEQDLARYDREIAARTGMDARPPTEGPQLPPRGGGPTKPPPAKKPGAGQVRFSPSRNVTQWLDPSGAVIREAQGDQRGK